MTRTPAYTRPQRIRIVVLAGVIPIVIAVASVIAMLSWTDLPDPIAVHWGPTGAPDGYGPVAAIALVFGICVLFYAVIISWSVALLRSSPRASAQPRFLVGTSVGFATLLMGALLGSVAIQRGLSDAAASPSVLPVLGAALVAATVLGFAAGLLAPRPQPAEPSEPSDEPTLTLAPEERAVFARTIPPTPAALYFFGFAAVLVVGAAVLVTIAADPRFLLILIAPVLVLVLAFTTLNWRLRIGRDGVLVRGAIGFPRYFVPLGEIAAASVVDVQAMAEFGGWGVRYGRGGRTGIILRSGEALEVTRHTGRSLVITVDDAATAAGLINGLVQRAGSSAR